jgi:hypothetical protein
VSPLLPVVSLAECAAYLKSMAGLSFRCLSRKHFAADFQEPLKCWRYFKDFDLASRWSRPSRKPSSPKPIAGPRLNVEVDCGVLVGHSSRPRSYAEVLLVSSIDGSLAHPSDQCTPPRTPVESDGLVVMLLVGPVDINVSRQEDPMLVEALAPSLQVAPAVKCLVGCPVG